MSENTYLCQAARDALSLSDVERIRHILALKWIGYPRAKQILENLEILISHPKVHRMPNLLLISPTNNGKTAIVRRFAEMHPLVDDPNATSVTIPVVFVDAPPGPDEGRLYSSILERVYRPLAPSSRIDQRAFQVKKLLSAVGTSMLIIDEIHNILTGGPSRQRQFLNVIKELGNELQIPIVGVGTDQALNAIRTDEQMVNRFEVMALPVWRDNEDYTRLLASFEKLLPLRQRSHLTSRDLAIRILGMSEGTIGEIAQVVKRAAVYAIRHHLEHITAECLINIHYIPPSNRRGRRAA